MDEFDAFPLPIGLVHLVEDFYSGGSLVDEFAIVESDIFGNIVAVMLAILEVLIYGRHVVGDFLGYTSRTQCQPPQVLVALHRTSNPTLTQQPPDSPASTMHVFLLYQPLARRAVPEPPLPPPMTM